MVCSANWMDNVVKHLSGRTDPKDSISKELNIEEHACNADDSVVT